MVWSTYKWWNPEHSVMEFICSCSVCSIRVERTVISSFTCTIDYVGAVSRKPCNEEQGQLAIDRLNKIYL